MSGRTTRAELDSLAAAIDDALGLPRGTHSVVGAYGGWKLVRDGGGADVSSIGCVRPGELADWMRAYKAGIYMGRQPR